MDQEHKKYLETTLQQMEHAADVFYVHAQRTNFHQFLEFTGFIREYIKVCRGLLARGVDFTTESGALQSHEAAYIGEKFGCIFTPLFECDPKVFQDFLRGAGISGGP